eukprot:Selendium_serpulae@DN3425_c0_g2_i2.p1
MEIHLRPFTTIGSELYSKSKHVPQEFQDFTFIPSKTNVTLDMKNYPYTIDPNRSGHLYIWGDYYSEGMANWIKRAAELLMIAKTLNATFVEPCIKNGSLRSCLSAKERFSPIPTRQFPRDTINVRLGDIFQIEKLKLFHPLIISHDEF